MPPAAPAELRTPPAPPLRSGPGEAGLDALLAVFHEQSATLSDLLGHWHARLHQPELWAHWPELYRTLGDRLLHAGDYSHALDVAGDGLRRFDGDVRLRQIQGIAWARSGAPEQANAILGRLAAEGHRDEETLGILARTHKDFALRAQDAEERRRHFRLAQEIYADAFLLNKDSYWTGINAATLALLLGDKGTSDEIARAVRKDCLCRLDPEHKDFYWVLATLGEAELVLHQLADAGNWYRQAADASRKQLGNRSTTRRQARLLLAHLGIERRWIDERLPIPAVAVFAGHMIDQAGRPRPRFPAALEATVKAEVRARLRKHDALIGYSSAACGSDILFVECLGELDGQPNVVLPYPRETFVPDSVEIIRDGHWGSRFDSALAKATTADPVAAGRMEQGSVSYDYANTVLCGLAMRRAAELETKLVGVAVWDGKPGDGAGGTASVVARWRQLGLNIELVPLDHLLRRECPELADSTELIVSVPVPQSNQTRILAMLFADAVGYSKFTEQQSLAFTKHCMTAIARLLLQEEFNDAIVRESRGDGVYVAFESAGVAGRFALALRRLIDCTSWTDFGLPADLTLRIGLHVGPVCRCFDPILGAQTWTGAHVSRAARVMAIAPPGLIYASEQFAAYAAVEKVADFTCEPLGRKEWAKDFGSYPTYVLRRPEPA